MTNSQWQGRWDQLKGLAMELWGELTGDDLEFIGGQRERLIGKLEEKYGMDRAEAERQADEFFNRP